MRGKNLQKFLGSFYEGARPSFYEGARPIIFRYKSNEWMGPTLQTGKG